MNSNLLCLILLYAYYIVPAGSISLLPRKRLECTEKTCYLDKSSLRFLLIGDIGGLPVYPYYTYAQQKVAFAMGRVAAKQGADFVVNLGDNFYFNGVSDVFDERFDSSFEDVYTDDALNVPWYIVAGNHDHLGNITVQQLYTQQSSKWTFPERLFYKLSYAASEEGRVTTLEIVFVDTIVLCGNTIDIQGEGVLDWLFSKKRQPDSPPPEYEKLAEEQWRWIDTTLANSAADYLFVVGHYPIYSASEHGSFNCLQKGLDPLLRKYRVNAYFSGHDHNLQHIQLNKSIDNNGGYSTMNYVVCGAGSRTDRSSKHIRDFTSKELKFRYPTGWNPLSQMGFSSGAFIHVEARQQDALLQFITSNQEVKYDLRLTPRN